MALREAEVLPKSAIAAARRYSLKLEPALRRHATDGRLEIDNNRVERTLHAVAVGNKNWTLFMTEGGGETAAALLSLVMTAKAIAIDPRVCLRDLLLRIRTASEFARLTRDGWQEGFADEIAAHHLAATTCLAGS